MSKVFISWAGEDDKKYAALVHDVLKIAFMGKIHIFYSELMQRGCDAINTVIENANDAKYGVIIATENSLNKNWVNFEVGVLINIPTTPILINISINKFNKLHTPLNRLQAVELKDFEALNIIIREISLKLDITVDYNCEKIAKDYFNMKFRFLEVPPIVKDVAQSACIDLTSLPNKSGIICSLSEDDFRKIRKQMIRKGEGKLILMGSSLKNAFNPEDEHVSILKIIEDVVSNKD